MDKKLEKGAKEVLDKAKSEGLEEDDQFWMAVGAVNAEARKRGVIPKDELSPEMNAASQAVVKAVQKGKP